jgi:hypothetical protein
MESSGIPEIAKPKALRSRQQMDYAFERSCGLPPAAACRAVGGKVENGHATKWEQSRAVQAWIGYYRKLGQTEEMLAAKRARVEQRLEIAAYGSIFDFATFADDGTNFRIDWAKVEASSYGAVISGFKFDKDTGRLTDFERDNALQALAQLRDMHGFKSVNKTALTDPTGEKPASIELTTDADRVRALSALLAKANVAAA